MSEKTLAEEIEEKAGGEEILGAVIGEMGWGEDYNSEDVPKYKEQPKNKLIPWNKARPLLNYEWYQSYGAPTCNAIYVWTESWVILVDQYDGATSVIRIPRNPIDCEPIMPGG